MDVHQPLREAQNLRFRFQMNRRLRLECLAAVSKVFREQDEPISDELLSTIVFALPQELVSGNGKTAPAVQLADDKDQSRKPGDPPSKPKPDPKPGNPPNPPGPKPGNPPEAPPENPPEPPHPENPPEPPPPPPPGTPPDDPASPPPEPLLPALPPEEPGG
jgi:hypothetical protein